MQNSGKPVVLITGSEGLIGDAIVRALHSDYDVASFDVERPHKRPDIQDFIHCDLTKDDSVTAALARARERHGSKIASVVHLAAYYDFSGKPSHLYRDLTVEGTRRLLRGLQSFEVEQFIFSSTHIVMAPSQAGEPITESSPIGADWDYPKSKLAAEQAIREERGAIPSVVLRIGGVYTEEGRTVPIAQQIARIYERQIESFFFPGDPSSGQAFVHLDDLVDLARLVIERRCQLSPYEVFLVAEPDLVSYDELQDIIGREIHGKDWPTIRIPKVIAKMTAWAQEKFSGEEQLIKPWMIDLADQHYPVSPDLAEEILGWQPRRRLRDTIPAMVRKLKEDPAKWYETNSLPVPEKVGR
jgi:nucleoside-diphosphate-sugar epimerase